MESNKNKILTLIAIITIVLTLIGSTYAYFTAQAGGTTSTNTTVTSNTTDLLTFSINRDISFTVTQSDFQENGTNKSGDATATATLTPNNKTGAATMNYYLYLNIESNPTVYSEANTNEDPELMLQVFDENNQLVTLTGLDTQKTIKGVTGYDITGVTGLKTLLDSHAISASNNQATIENWKVVITLINLDVNQNDNTGKTISAEIIIRQDEIDESDLILTINNASGNNCNQTTINCNGVTAVWNNKINQLEISSLDDMGSCTIICETSSGTPLNTYITNLSGTIQGEGELVHEIGNVPDYDNKSVVKSFGTTPVYFRNTISTSLTQTQVDSYWTFDNSTGVFTSDPSKMTWGSSANYHVYAKVPEAGFYQICYTIYPSSTIYNSLYLAKDTSSFTSIGSLESSINEGCYDMGYFDASSYLNISQRGYSGTSSPVMSFKIEKFNASSLDTGYRYEGRNPNNYIWFNNELWRIIGVFDSSSHGKVGKNLVKIMRAYSIGSYAWNGVSGYKNDWPNSTLYRMLNGCYMYQKNGNETINLAGLSGSCSAYSVGNYNSSYGGTFPGYSDFTKIGIKDEYRNMIEEVTWYLGGGGKSGYRTYYPDKIYSYERDVNTVYNNNSLSTIGHIGLMYLSDYAYSVLDSSCGRNAYLLTSYNNTSCVGQSWLFGKGSEWTISPNGDSKTSAWYISDNGRLYDVFLTNGRNIRPVLYLLEDVYRISGNGTIEDPYIIGM